MECKEEKSTSIAPAGWEKAVETSDSEHESEYNGTSLHSVPLTRHPSLSDISTIAENCSTSPVLKGKVALEDKAEEMSSEIAITEMAISLLASQASTRSSGTQLNQCRSKYSVPATPPKVESSTSNTFQKGDDPLTPTANLKMLVSAASPAIRDREIKKRELFSDDANPCVLPSFALPVFDSKVVIRNGSFTRVEMENGSEKIAISRKDKSLGLLCQRFLSKYPEHPLEQETIEISLDEVAKDLSVERRRIYDIVNVLESVEVISRFAKNRYMWHGKSRLPQTLARLKRLAISQGFSLKGGSSGKENPNSPPSNKANLLSKSSVGNKFPLLLPKDSNIPNPSPLPNSQEMDDEEIAWAKKQREADYCRKDKSLGVLSQKFLMMFLVSETRQVTLDDAANLLIENHEEGQSKFKTKVRRLYDIANILSSLQLIQKVHIHNIQTGRKPGFRWIGIDLDSLGGSGKRKAEEIAPPPVKRFNNKQSLLAEIEDKEESLFGRLISRRPSQQQIRRAKSESSGKNKLPRSRSDHGLACKKRALSCDYYNNVRDSDEDGYSIQEITGTVGDTVSASPSAVKFHSELRKLQEQYPNRMSQLLSACRQGLTPDSIESKKSRRMLFTGATRDDEPNAKKSTLNFDEETSAEKEIQDTKMFVHSATSPFKPFQVGEETLTSYKSRSNSRRASTEEKVQHSPEQKILQERQKQKKLLEEQKDFNLQDERWKRMERELDRAFSHHPSTITNLSSPVPFENVTEHSSVGIQASLIEDVSPLKPLSYYLKHLQPWHPIAPKCKAPLANQKSATPSPVQFQHMGVTPLAPSVLSPAPVCSINGLATVTNEVQMVNSLNALLVPMPTAPVSTIWTSANCTPPSGQSTPSPNICLKLPQQMFNSPALYSPHSLTPCTTPTADINMVELREDNHFMGNCSQGVSQSIPGSTMTLPVSIVNSLNNQHMIGSSVPGLQMPIMQPAVRLQTPVLQGYGSQLVVTPIQSMHRIQGIPTSMQMATPILPKGMQPQHLFTSMPGETPSNSATFMFTNIAKSLVLPEPSMSSQN